MTTSNKKLTANRINGRKSRGPIDTSSSRFNAAKHRLLAEGITELDDADGYEEILNDLMREKAPVGPVEIFLVKAAALHMVRWTRASCLEALFISSILNPPLHAKDPLRDLDLDFRGAIVDPGIPAAIGAGGMEFLGLYQRYISFSANGFFKVLHELERLQRARQGERLPAPAAVDVTVYADAGRLDSTPAAPEQSKAPSSDGERLPAPAAIDVTVCADAGRLDSTPATPVQSKAPSSDGERLPAPAAADVTVYADAARLDSTPTAPEQSKAPSSDGEDGHAESGLVESAPPGPEHGVALTAMEVADGEIPVADSAPVAWKPRAPSGPIWNR